MLMVRNYGDIVELPAGDPFPEWASVRVNWPDRPDWPWMELRLEVVEGRPVAVAFTVAYPNHADVVGPWIRSLPLPEIVHDAVLAVGARLVGDHLFMDYPRYGVDEANAELTRARAVAGRTRQRVSRELLEKIAAIYRADRTGAPTVAVADAVPTSHRNATRLVARAREEGLLEPYERGGK